MKEVLKDSQLTWLSLQKVLDEIQSSLDEEARQMVGPWNSVDAFPSEVRFRRTEPARGPDGLPAMQFYLTRAGRQSCAESRQLIREMPPEMFIIC